MIVFRKITTKKNILFFTVHKAASMFIYKVCHDLCKAAGLSYYSINHNKNSRYYFDTESGGLDDIGIWGARTGCFAPLRYYFMVPEELNARIILHLRDPRDVLVSLYYSEAFSHSVIKGVFDLGRKERNEIVEKGIDTFVLTRAVEFNNKYAEYRCLLSRPNVVFVKYEDLVCNLSAWLGAVAKNFDIVDIKCIDKIWGPMIFDYMYKYLRSIKWCRCYQKRKGEEEKAITSWQLPVAYRNNL